MGYKLLILYKIVVINDIINIINSYCNLFDYVDHFFINCDKTIASDMIIINNLITFKIEENNWESLLIKTIKSFNYFKNKNYSHIMVSNVNTFINIPILYKKLGENECSAFTGNHTFKNTTYKFPSGCGYIFNINVVKNICDFFYNNRYILDNKLSHDFISNYPSTDDIFFGYYLFINKIKINNLERYDILDNNVLNNQIIRIVPHVRIKTGNLINDANIHVYLRNLIYK